MTLGIMIGSIISGQTISRTGRYRVFPIVGSVRLLIAISLFIFHYVAWDTPLWQIDDRHDHVRRGAGLHDLQPLTLAVQSAVPPQ
jgi:hypothetical protein